MAEVEHSCFPRSKLVVANSEHDWLFGQENLHTNSSVLNAVSLFCFCATLSAHKGRGFDLKRSRGWLALRGMWGKRSSPTTVSAEAEKRAIPKISQEELDCLMDKASK